MPRLRVVKKPEDSAEIPPDQAVQVVLPDETAEIPEPEGEKTQKKPEPQQIDDSGIAALQKQLEDMKKSHEVAIETERQRALEADRQRQEAEKRAQQKDQELTRVGSQKDAAEFDAILAALAAHQAESDAAQRDIEFATANNDTKLMIDANRRLARAESRLGQIEDSKAAYEARREQRSKAEAERPQQTQPVGDPIEAHVNAMPGLMPSQRQWLLSHRELMTDGRKNIRLQNAHIDAEDAGHSPGSEAYFHFLEERLGYRKAETTQATEEDEMPEDTSKKAGMVSAPPSRETRSMSSGAPNSNRITLTPEQREAARMAGIDEVTYAKQLIKLNTFKKDGYYSHN